MSNVRNEKQREKLAEPVQGRGGKPGGSKKKIIGEEEDS